MGRLTVEEDPGEDLACYGKKRESSIAPTVCSIIFLVDGYNAGILPCLWYRAHLPDIGNQLVQYAEQIVSSFNRNSRCFAIVQAGDCSSHLSHGCNLIEVCLGNALRDVVQSFMIYVARDVE